MEREIVSKTYIPVYVLDKEEVGFPWYQLFATVDCYGHVEAKWVYDPGAGMEYHSETLSPLLEQDSHDGVCMRRPLVIDTFIEDPDELRALAENLTF